MIIENIVNVFPKGEVAFTKQFIYQHIVQHCGLCVGRQTDQPNHAAQANLDRHFSPPVDFLFQE